MCCSRGFILPAPQYVRAHADQVEYAVDFGPYRWNPVASGREVSFFWNNALALTDFRLLCSSQAIVFELIACDETGHAVSDTLQQFLFSPTDQALEAAVHNPVQFEVA